MLDHRGIFRGRGSVRRLFGIEAVRRTFFSRVILVASCGMWSLGTGGLVFVLVGGRVLCHYCFRRRRTRGGRCGSVSSGYEPIRPSLDIRRIWLVLGSGRVWCCSGIVRRIVGSMLIVSTERFLRMTLVMWMLTWLVWFSPLFYSCLFYHPFSYTWKGFESVCDRDAFASIGRLPVV